MRSMTGYGRAISRDLDGLQWIVEIQGTNREGLDFSLFLPKGMLDFEMHVRRRLREILERGQITVRIDLKRSLVQQQAGGSLLAHLKKIQSTWIDLASGLGYEKEAIDLPFLLSQLEQLRVDELTANQKELQALLNLTLDQAITAFLEMKEQEGKQLGMDLSNRLQAIQSALSAIEKEGEQNPSKFYTKLKQRLLDLAGSTPGEDERILRELALYADKVDITEEVTRLYSHLQQAFDLYQKQQTCKGRMFDFLIQEMQREISTISAKSASLEIINRALFIRAELKKIREQVQNIE